MLVSLWINDDARRSCHRGLTGLTLYSIRFRIVALGALRGLLLLARRLVRVKPSYCGGLTMSFAVYIVVD